MSFPLPCDRHRRHLQNLLTLPNGRPCPLNTPSCRSRPPAPARAPRPPVRATRSRGRVGSRRICLFVPISLSTLCSSFVHAIACDSISFLPDAERYCIACADHTCVSVRPRMDAYSLPLWAVVNSATKNMGVKMSVQGSAVTSLGTMPRADRAVTLR